jgi:predicted secreted protein
VAAAAPLILAPIGLAAVLGGCSRGSLPSADRVEERQIASEAPHYQRRETEPVALVERDAERPLDVANGQTIVIRLSRNRSTGYRWTLVSPSDGALRAIGEATYTPGGGVGGEGVETWSFLATQTGRQELHFEYRRPWEPMMAPAKSLTYEIGVR